MLDEKKTAVYATDVPEIEDVQGQKHVAPPYRPNPWAKMVHILAGDHLWDSIKGHRGDF